MNVARLIEKLQKFDPELEVITEGCDCFGDAHDVFQDEFGEGDRVLITREGGGYEEYLRPSDEDN